MQYIFHDVIHIAPHISHITVISQSHISHTSTIHQPHISGIVSGGGRSKAIRSVWLSKRVERSKQCNEFMRKLKAMMRLYMNFFFSKIKSDLLVCE